jgi:glycosyltransferase involved in cell wall biosynthesis
VKKNITNVLILSSRSNTGAGGEQYIQNLVQYIDRTRFNPIVAIPDEGSLRAALEAFNITVVCFDINYGWIKPVQHWYKALSKLQERVVIITDFIRKNNIELVHTNSNIYWEGAFAARLCGIHHIYAIRVDFDPSNHLYTHFPIEETSFAQLMASLSTRIIAVSKECAHSLSPPVPIDKIGIINNGINTTKYDQLLASYNPVNIRTELGILVNSPLITAVGRIVPDKGFDIYLEAALEILKTHPGTHFLLVGADENQEYADTLKQKVNQHQINKQFHFLGFRSDVAEILIASDIFVLSSRHEGQSNALLEAMACECAVMATRCSGVEDAIIDHETGLLIEIDDTEALMQALSHLLYQPEERSRLAKAAKQRIKSHFQIQDKVNQLMQFYDETLTLTPPPAGSPEITLLLQAAKEIGILGRHTQELEYRVRQLEHLGDKFTQNPFMKVARKLKTRFFA